MDGPEWNYEVFKEAMVKVKAEEKTKFEHTQHAELDSWFSQDPTIERDKRIREVIRYPLLKKQMGMDFLETQEMVVADIGCGPYLGVSSVVSCKRVDRFDPLINDYAKHYPQTNGFAIKAEDLKERLGEYDLIIATNCIDHFESPESFMADIVKYMKPGAYFAHLHAINNAYSHPHEAHAHNVNQEIFHKYLYSDFELCWELDYQHDGLVYSWRKQPSFSQLWRKVSGYKK